MKRNNRLEVVATLVLAAICTFLILRLIVRVRSVSAGTSGGMPVARPQMIRSRRIFNVLPQKVSAFPDGPVLNVALFDRLQEQTLAVPDRDPFSFAPTAQQVQQAQQLEQEKQKGKQNRVSGPPPPPPVPLKALGYVQDARGQFQAYLTDSDSIYAVHEGEKFDKVYRVLKITPAFVEIEDQSLNLRAQLAVPQ
jgi:hypothetical protein